MTRYARAEDHYFSAHPRSKPRFGLIRTSLRGKTFEFLTSSGVFSRGRIDSGTSLLIESMILPKEGRALDVGCGYGPIGIAAAALNPELKVTLIDINARAVRLAKKNIEKNCVSNAEAKRGYLYEPAKNQIFDCVLSNPPVSAGLETVRELISSGPEHLRRRATLQVVFKSKVGGKRIQSIFEEAFGNVEVLARQSGYRVLMSEKQ